MLESLIRLRDQIRYRNAWAYNELERFRYENPKYAWGGGYGHSMVEDFCVIYLIREGKKFSSSTKDRCSKINRFYEIRNFKIFSKNIIGKFDAGGDLKFIEFWVNPKGYFSPLEYVGKGNWRSRPDTRFLYDPF